MRAALVTWFAIVAPVVLSAQSLRAPAFLPPTSKVWDTHGSPMRTDSGVTPSLRLRGEKQPRGSYWAIAASALMPGSGQAMLGEQRFLPYAAFEVFTWFQYAAHAHESRERRDNYRSLAATVARSPFSASHPLGDFDYYERLEHYLESGTFDALPGGELDPEPDTATYNGFVWLLARRTFWKDVNRPPARNTEEWQLAERLYRRRAYTDDYRWTWRNAQLEFDEYRREIRGANDANRQAVQALGLMIANHTLSMVDAFVTIRVRRRVGGPAGPRTELSVSLPVR
ncbi:MAG: hypothetical protein U0132_11680 [Gemmatimonadaceae bacterium]